MIHHPEKFRQLHCNFREAEASWSTYNFFFLEDWYKLWTAGFEFLFQVDCHFEDREICFGLMAPHRFMHADPLALYKRLSRCAWSFLPTSKKQEYAEFSVDPHIQSDPYLMWTDYCLLEWHVFNDRDGELDIIGEHSTFNPFTLSADVIENLKLSNEAFDEQASAIPHWDSELRVLRFRGQVIRSIRAVARKPILILDAFQESAWPQRIDNPLAPYADLSEAVRTLNSELHGIEFRRDGSGEGILWKVCSR